MSAPERSGQTGASTRRAPRVPAPRRRKTRLASIAVVSFFGAACASNAALELRSASTLNALHEVEARGALRCAPRELAVARSHVEFAALEREQGFVSRAEAHLDVAEENVRAARVLAASPRCTGGGAVAPRRPSHDHEMAR